MKRLVYLAGNAWLLVVGALILFGTLVVPFLNEPTAWEAIKRIQHHADPHNVTNYVVNLLALSPGLVLRHLGQKRQDVKGVPE